jgi:hypothetical protein
VPGDNEFRDLGDRDAYEVLGLPRDATDAQVQDRYRLLMGIWHPDRKPPGSQARRQAEDKARELNIARRYVTGRRDAYDAFLARRDRVAAGHQHQPAAAGYQQRDPWDDVGPAPRRRGAQATGPPHPAPPPGAARRPPRRQPPSRHKRTDQPPVVRVLFKLLVAAAWLVSCLLIVTVSTLVSVWVASNHIAFLIAAVLGWVVIAALIGAAIWGVVRHTRRRRRRSRR